MKHWGPMEEESDVLAGCLREQKSPFTTAAIMGKGYGYMERILYGIPHTKQQVWARFRLLNRMNGAFGKVVRYANRCTCI